MMQLLLETALDFETDYAYPPGWDIEDQAMNSAPGKKLLQSVSIQTIISGVKSLPFEATQSLRHLLDFLCRYDFDSCWQAMLLRMGLFLANTQGRLAWYVAVSSILYSYELVVKFRVPTKIGHNIYYADSPTLGTCIEGQGNIDWENLLQFRDESYYSESKINKVSELQDEDTFWYGVLSQLRRGYRRQQLLSCTASF